MGNNAVAHHIDAVEAQAGRTGGLAQVRCLQVQMVKGDGAWKLLAHQGTNI